MSADEYLAGVAYSVDCPLNAKVFAIECISRLIDRLIAFDIFDKNIEEHPKASPIE
jgi:hypothetical protein